MSLLELHLPDLDATDRLARRLAPHLRPGDLIALHGNLGAGKTTFARALISTLSGRQTDVPSPTYTLIKTYETPGLTIYHFDLYRLEDPDEVLELGWDDTLDGLALVEWPARAGHHLPQWRLDLTLEQTVDGRTARLEAHGEDWQARLHGI